MSVLDQIGLTTFEAIRLRFPRAAKNRVRGNGPHLILLRCSAIWTFLCYQTAAERDEAYESWQHRKCEYMHCAFDHSRWDLNAK